MYSAFQSRQRKTKDPCPVCFLHKALCICSEIPFFDLQTRILLVVHAKELKRTTNTGRLAAHALRNSKICVRGQLGSPLDLSPYLSPEYQSLLLFPSESAIELSTFLGNFDHSRRLQLIVPDGNWRQASKVSHRHPELAGIPRVKISTPNLSSEHLRREHFDEGMSTLQAIALALGMIEGSEIGARLRQLYHVKLRATLIGRGVY